MEVIVVVVVMKVVMLATFAAVSNQRLILEDVRSGEVSFVAVVRAAKHRQPVFSVLVGKIARPSLLNRRRVRDAPFPGLRGSTRKRFFKVIVGQFFFGLIVARLEIGFAS